MNVTLMFLESVVARFPIQLDFQSKIQGIFKAFVT